MNVREAERKLRETITEIRQPFTNKKWCRWADARLCGADRTAASPESAAKEMSGDATKATTTGRPPSRAAMLRSPAGNGSHRGRAQ
jgi:hypothetical protein